MLEYYLITAIVAAAVAGLFTYLRLTAKDKPVVPVPGQDVAAAANTSQPRRLFVPGATHVPLRMVNFLRLFGLANAPLRDFCFIQGPLTKEQLHPVVSSTLVQMHCNGDALGPGIMEFLFHGYHLKPTETLSFVLLDGKTPEDGRIVVVVDKLRFFAVQPVMPS